MKWAVWLVLFALFLLTGCAAAIDTAVKTESSPDVSVEPAQLSLPSALAQEQAVTPIPAENREYFKPEGRYGVMSGTAFAGPEELNMLAITLRLKNWKSLAVVLAAFGWHLQDACINDVRMVDIARHNGYDTEFDISLPQYDEENGIAYIVLRTGEYQHEACYVLVFQKNNERGYGMKSIITLNEDYYAETPRFTFQTIGSKHYLVWDEIWAHGTGFEDYSQEWYDTDTGQRVYTYDTHGYEAECIPDEIEEETWEAAVSHGAIPVGNAGDFYLQAQYSRSFSFTNGAADETYTCEYQVYYDALQGMFYAAYDALLPLYLQAALSPTEYVRDWAERRIAYIDELRKYSPDSSPVAEDRMVLPMADFQTEKLELMGGALSEERLHWFCESLNAVKTGKFEEMGRLLSSYDFWKYGNGGITEGVLKGSLLNGISNVSCTLDMDSCKERIALLHLRYDREGERRGATFVYVLGDEGDRWRQDAVYAYPLAQGESAVEATYLDGYASYLLKIPVGRANGHTVYESVMHNTDLIRGLQFVSEYYDSKGNKYTLDLSRPAFPKEAACVLLARYYEAGKADAQPKETAGVAVWTDWEWQNDAPFVDVSEYSRIQRFFQYDN